MSYLLGNLLGRAITSYVVILIVWVFASRFDLKKAFRSSLRWYNWLLVLLLTFIGLAIKASGG